MKRISLSVWAVALTMTASFVSHPVEAARSLPGSFLKWTVTSPTELSSQVSQAPDVAKRYVTYYKKDPASIAKSFKSLKVITLSKDLRTKAYYISPSGKITSKMKLLPAGTMVFADAKGRPVLEYKCGNPLSADLPEAMEEQISKKPAPVEQPASAPVAEAPKPVEVAQAPAVQTPTEPVFTEVLSQPAEVFTGANTVAPAVAETATTAVQGAPIAVAGGGGGGGLGLLAAVPLLFLGGGGGGSTSTPPVVPEPGAIVTMASGMIGFAALAVRRRK